MKVKLIKLSTKAVVPEYQTSGAAGFDLVATEDVRILPGECKLVGIGLAFEIPEGYEMQIRPRSSISYKTNLRVANAPGTIDSDYRGEVKIIVENNSANDPIKAKPQIIRAGDRIAQGVIQKVEQVEFDVGDRLGSTSRGTGGIGSTGTSSN